MSAYSELVQNLVTELKKFPGVGPRSAERILFYLLKAEKQDIKHLSDLLLEVKEKVFFCKVCNNLSEDSVCHICKDEDRDKSTICVVEEPKDVIFLEKCGTYKGVYHVLLGALSPLSGIGPKELKVPDLEARLADGGTVKEVIIATNFNNDGEATALYLKKKLAKHKVKVTRIARGVPTGSNLEYVDEDTLSCAMLGRREYS